MTQCYCFLFFLISLNSLCSRRSKSKKWISTLQSGLRSISNEYIIGKLTIFISNTRSGASSLIVLWIISGWSHPNEYLHIDYDFIEWMKWVNIICINRVKTALSVGHTFRRCCCCYCSYRQKEKIQFQILYLFGIFTSFCVLIVRCRTESIRISSRRFEWLNMWFKDSVYPSVYLAKPQMKFKMRFFFAIACSRCLEVQQNRSVYLIVILGLLDEINNKTDIFSIVRISHERSAAHKMWD